MSYSAYDNWLDAPLRQQEADDDAAEARASWANEQAESLASWPLLAVEKETVSNHFAGLDWSENQSIQLETLVTKLVLGQPVTAEDCSEFLTLESLRSIIAESIIENGDRYLIDDGI